MKVMVCRYTVEDSVYVDKDNLGHGAGRALLSDLIDRCTALGYRQMIAVIGDSANATSIALHSQLGFKVIGALEASGGKFDRWVDTVLMQRPLGDGSTTAPENLLHKSKALTSAGLVIVIIFKCATAASPWAPRQ